MINGPSNESEEFDSPKRSCSSTIIIENRKRSLAQSSDDEVSSNISNNEWQKSSQFRSMSILGVRSKTFLSKYFQITKISQIKFHNEILYLLTFYIVW